MNCKICSNEFDFDKKLPIKVHCCKENICDECFKKNIKSCANDQYQSYDCPMCEKQNSKITILQPKQLELKQYDQKFICNSHNKKAKFICKELKKYGCYYCFFESDIKCQQIKQFDQQEIFQDLQDLKTQLQNIKYNADEKVSLIQKFTDQQITNSLQLDELLNQIQDKNEKLNFNKLKFLKLILNENKFYDRDNKIYINDQSKHGCQRIQEIESSFYNIESQNTLFGDINGLQNLAELIDCKILKLQLIYKGSKDGFKAKQFHDKCDNYQKTLTLIQSNNNQIFGGYNNQSWKINNQNKNGQILFSITKNQRFKFKEQKIQLVNKENITQSNNNQKAQQGLFGSQTFIPLNQNQNQDSKNSNSFQFNNNQQAQQSSSIFSNLQSFFPNQNQESQQPCLHVNNVFGLSQKQQQDTDSNIKADNNDKKDEEIAEKFNCQKYGPIFGYDSLIIQDDCNINFSQDNYPYDLCSTKIQNHQCVSGQKQFQVQEIEVYDVITYE